MIDRVQTRMLLMSVFYVMMLIVRYPCNSIKRIFSLLEHDTFNNYILFMSNIHFLFYFADTYLHILICFTDTHPFSHVPLQVSC